MAVKVQPKPKSISFNIHVKIEYLTILDIATSECSSFLATFFGTKISYSYTSASICLNTFDTSLASAQCIAKDSTNSVVTRLIYVADLQLSERLSAS